MPNLQFLLMVLLILTAVLGAGRVSAAPAERQSDDCRIDLMLALDTSNSVDLGAYEFIRRWALGLVSSFTMSPTNAHIGVLQFSIYSELETGLQDDRAVVTNALMQMGKINSSTNISAALEMADEELRKGRADTPKVIILVTDGVHNIGPEPIAVADELRDSETRGGTIILVVAVGSSDLDEINGIAGGEFNVINVSDFSGLPEIRDILRDYTCAVATNMTNMSYSEFAATYTHSVDAPMSTNSDYDSDGIADQLDNCHTAYNPTQEDVDGDTVGDVCDNVNSNDYKTPSP